MAQRQLRQLRLLRLLLAAASMLLATHPTPVLAKVARGADHVPDRDGEAELARAKRSASATADARASLRSGGSVGRKERYLLANPFEEDCFNPGKEEVAYKQFEAFARTTEVPRLWDRDAMRDSYEYSLGQTKQRFKSCGQFNNVLQLLLHTLAVGRTLNRTVVLPGFYFRKGLRRTRIDHFEEEWYPTSHFLNTSRLRAAGYR